MAAWIALFISLVSLILMIVILIRFKKLFSTDAIIEKTKAQIEREIAEIPGLQKDILSTHEATGKLTEIFVPVDVVEHTRLLDENMNKLAEENKIKLMSLKVAPATVSEIKYYYYNYEDKYKEARSGADVNGDLQAQNDAEYADSINLKDRPTAKILKTDYAITAYGTKKNIWDYLEAIKKLDKAVTVSKVNFGDYTFGKDEAKKAGVELPDSDDGEEHKVDAGGKQISNAVPTQIVVTLYSVYEMDKPNVD